MGTRRRRNHRGDRAHRDGAGGGRARATGCAVSALVRDTARAAERLPVGDAARLGRDAAAPPPEAAFEGVDVVVNLIGESVSSGRWNEARKKRLRDSRVVGHARAGRRAAGSAEAPARAHLGVRRAGYYGDRGDEILTETSARGTGFIAELGRDWEAEAMQGGRDRHARRACCAAASCCRRTAGILRKILPPFRLGLGGKIGSGAQWMPWIHLDDEIGLIRHAMAHEAVAGPLNLVAPEPVTNGEFVRALGETLGRPTVLTAPAFALRLAFGAMTDELLLASQRAMPVRTLETGYAFRHPLLREALGELLAKGRSGTPGGGAELDVGEGDMRVRQNTPLPPPTAADVESRVAERTRELEAARAELEARSRHSEEVDRLKNAFIANMSHEIRTPLNSVLALTQLLRDGVAGPLTVDQRKYLQVIERNGQALLHLINDVLDLSRIEAGHLEMDTQDRRPRAAHRGGHRGALAARGGQEPGPGRQAAAVAAAGARRSRSAPPDPDQP